MIPDDRQQLLAERASLERLLSEIPEENVIDRMSLESRRQEIDEMLAEAKAPRREPVRARLTFGGKPIVGSHGILAEFGASAVKTFADAVAAIGAGQTTALGSRGAIPNREHYDLLITGTAVGSFGFELEQAHTSELPFRDTPSPIETAIEQTKAILRATTGTDDELGDAISGADPRALEALRVFLKVLSDQEAVCAIAFRDDFFRFHDAKEVQRSENRLRQDNIHEDTMDIVGRFQGVLPVRRTFEFFDEQTGDTITGKVGPAIENAAEINKLLDARVTMRVHKTQVGKGNPRYELLGYEQASDSHEGG